MSKQGRFRKKKTYYSQVSNHALRDDFISLKAKGLYSLIQSYITLEDFILYKTTLLKQCKEGKKAFNSSWKELKDAGYLKQYKMKNDKGSFYYEYELLDKKENPQPQNGGGGKRTSGKGGMYNNTDSNNTDLNNTENIKGNFTGKDSETSLYTFEEYLKKFNTATDLNAEIVIQNYIYKYKKHIKNIEIRYTKEKWEKILNNIMMFEDEHRSLIVDYADMINTIDKHINTQYNHKEMYYLHNFKGEVKRNRLYEVGVL